MARKKAKKAEQTKQRLLDVSLELFLKKGFENTTMREIAANAGLAPGAAYYHFSSKESMIFDFYENSYEAHLILVDEILAQKKSLKDRLAGVVAAQIQVAEPYKGISKALFKTAIDPDQDISPFSQASKPLRDKNIAIMVQVLEGSTRKAPPKLRAALPELFWLFKMGMILYWLHDRSTDGQKTYRLINKGADIIAKVIGVAGLPVIQSVSAKALGLLDEFRPY